MTEVAPSRALAEELVRRWRSVTTTARSEDGGRTEPRVPEQLSFAQEGIWAAERLRASAGTDGQASIVFAGVSKAPLDRAALAGAVEHTGQRHPVLLAGVQDGLGVARQVSTGSRLTLERAGLVSPAGGTWPDDAELARLAQATAAEAFDLASGPLVRVRVIELPAGRDLLVIAAHHLAADGWSMAALLDELVTAYTSQARHDAAPTPARPGIGFGDFADQQRAMAGSARWQAATAHWRGRLADPGSPLFPADYPAPGRLEHEPGWCGVMLPRPLCDRLRAFARDEQASVFSVLLASFQLALGRWSGQPSVMIGCPAANRGAGLRHMVGMAANLLLLRADLADDPSLRVLTRRTHGEVAAALAFADVPFEYLARQLRLSAGGGTELISAGLTWESWPMPELAWDGIGMRRVEVGVGRPLRPIELYLRQEEGVIRGRAEFDCHRLARVTVTRLIACWQRLLTGALADPGRPGSALPFTPPDASQQAARPGLATTVPAIPVTEQFARHAAATPGNLAVAGGGQELSYGQLNAATDQLAGYLREVGVRPGRVVATVLPRGPELIAAMLAVLKAGGAYLPLDPGLPAEYLRQQLSAADATAMITPAPQAPALGIPAVPVAFTGGVLAITPADAPSRGADRSGRSARAPRPADLAYVIYTSGSAGQPKAVMVTHQSLTSLCAWHQRAYCITRADRASQVASPAFDAAGWEIWPYLTAGASIHIMPADVRADPAAVITWLAASDITACFLPTPLAELALTEPGLAQVRLRVLLTGGDRLTRRPPSGAAFQLFNNYGPTETTVVATWDEVRAEGAEPGPPPIGRPVDNCLMRVYDQHRQLVPVGAPGELYIGGAGLAAGYLGQPELTAECFVTGPDGTRLYRTGDLVRLREDGRLEFLGRADRQVKVRGIRIEPAEIEAMLASHPDVVQAVAGELDGRLVAWVVTRPGTPVTGPDLRRWLAGRCPAQLIPAQWVVLAAIPVTSNGKRDHAALATAARRPVARPESGSAAGPAEEILAAAWCAALSLGSVGPDEDFFEIGGDSLAAMRIVSLARQHGLVISPDDVLHHPTIRALAAVTGPPAPPLTASPPLPAWAPASRAGPGGDEIPLVPCQQELLARGWRAPHWWDQCLLAELDEPLDPGLLAKIATVLTDRHDSLRLRFTRTEHGWRQTVAPPGGGYGTIVHPLGLGAHPPATWPRLLSDTAVARQEMRDLANGPLMSLVPASAGPGQPGYLLASVHHLAVDALSVWILLSELFTAYRQQQAGQPIDLPPVTTPYATWARLIASTADTSRIRDQENYWREQCQPGAAIGYDHDTGPLQTGSNERRSVVLDQQRTRRLAATGIPVQDVVLTAVAMTLARPGEGMLVVDIRDHGRRLPGREIDLSWTTGWFTSVYPVRLPLQAATPAQMLTEVSRRVAAVPDHGLGYSLLKHMTDGGRPDLTSPAPVSVNYIGNLGSGLPAGMRPLLDQVQARPDGRVASRCPVQIPAGIIAGELRLECFLSRNRFRGATMDAFARALETTLIDLIDNWLPAVQGR
jgi:amino acid adenylation domain-containing protein/non-ribosomal peptide synthase protein (TIGR01720 family)